MENYRFVFRNAATGELRQADNFALNPAARSVGLIAPLVAPWMPWECWVGAECVWHYTADGDCVKGARAVLEPVAAPSHRTDSIYCVSVYVRVTDPDAVIAAARKRAQLHPSDDIDIEMALRLLIDTDSVPVEGAAGVEDSTCELVCVEGDSRVCPVCGQDHGALSHWEATNPTIVDRARRGDYP